MQSGAGCNGERQGWASFFRAAGPSFRRRPSAES
jgi:hypothetical protein